MAQTEKMKQVCTKPRIQDPIDVPKTNTSFFIINNGAFYIHLTTANCHCSQHSDSTTYRQSPRKIQAQCIPYGDYTGAEKRRTFHALLPVMSLQRKSVRMSQIPKATELKPTAIITLKNSVEYVYRKCRFRELVGNLLPLAPSLGK